MRSSYSKDDVTILLKDITGIVKHQPTQKLEKLIQSVQIELTKEPKVQSTAIKEMREEVKKLIKK